jgi:hypothetical protein
MVNESTSSSSSCSFVAGADAVGARGVEGDHALALVPASSVPRKVACESAAGAASAWKPGDGEEKTEKDRSRCSITDDALRVIPRRGDGDCGCARDDSAKMAPTTTLSSTNHAAPEPSHAGSGQHHHPAAAIIGAPSIACLA